MAQSFGGEWLEEKHALFGWRSMPPIKHGIRRDLHKPTNQMPRWSLHQNRLVIGVQSRS